MRVIRFLLLGMAALLLLAGTAAAALPGPQRAICPQCFGLSEIGQNVFIDDPARGPEIAGLIAAARTNDAGFFRAPLQARPRIVVCTTMACDRAFGGGSRAKGATYGDVFIRFGPLLLAEPIFAHELVHAELSHGAPWFGLSRRFPAWFNEGLAVYVSRDERYRGVASADDVAWIKGAVSTQDWLRFAGGSGHAYEAARTAVGDLARRIGDAGLRKLVARVKAGEDFDAVLAAIDSAPPRG